MQAVLQLMTNHSEDARQGVLVPIPQYPLYSATLAEYDLHQISYYLHEPSNWGLDVEELERAIAESRDKCS